MVTASALRIARIAAAPYPVIAVAKVDPFHAIAISRIAHRLAVESRMPMPPVGQRLCRALVATACSTSAPTGAVDASADVNLGGGKYRIQLFGRNITGQYHWSDMSRSVDVRRYTGIP